MINAGLPLISTVSKDNATIKLIARVANKYIRGTGREVRFSLTEPFMRSLEGGARAMVQQLNIGD